MSHRSFLSMRTTAAMIVVLSLAPRSGVAQASGGGAQAPAPKAAVYTPPRTPDGQPDMQGMWLPNGAGQPMERASGGDQPRPGRGGAGANGGAAREPQKPMVVDPPDGRVPLQPWAVARRDQIINNQHNLEDLDPRIKCMPSGVPRVNTPIAFNTYHFLQIPGYVILLYEWNHISRIIPLDGRPHLNPNIHLWMGDSRGRWEGNTLVVDATNFNDKTWIGGIGAAADGVPASALTNGSGVFHTEALHVVERFTLVDADTIHYEATIEDPTVFTKPWKLSWDAFKRAPKDHMLFEYACYEGGRRDLLLMTGVDVDATAAK